MISARSSRAMLSMLVPLLAAAAWLASDAARAQPAADTESAALRAVSALARLNGEALACHEMQAARRAKQLMLAHAPKTPRYGTLYDDGTREAYLTLARSAGPCPEAAVFNTRLDAVAAQLQAVLPATAAAPATAVPTGATK
ncbi:MAG: hypothetical protein IPM15_12610 [Betaproteobacteria bacterium]|nr:hypothetical protein [Betaproteobacteria bacterium]MCC6246495.1 hypothetical protein [Rubrivivax sp.]